MDFLRNQPGREAPMKYLIAILGLSVALSWGCNKDGIPVEIGSACSEGNDGKYLAATGVLDDRGSIFCSNIGGGPVRCMLDVGAEKGGTRVFGADIEQGSGASEIEKLASNYQKSDIKIRDNSGSVISLDDKFRFTGKMSVVPGSTCFMTVDKIEKAQ
jgi:hypothetical protein